MDKLFKGGDVKMSYGFKIIVEGDYALYTRPESKVERVSYDVPTPSALEGLIKSVYWKPAIQYRIQRIIVFNPIRFLNVRRNEVKSKISLSKVKMQMKGNNSAEIFASEERSQRASMLLRDVKYGIEFCFDLTGFQSEKDDEGVKKHYNILKRRLEKGQCFRQPCLGMKEFAVSKIALVEDFDYYKISPELKGTMDLGYMLYRMKFKDGGSSINGDWENPKFSDDADPIFYHPYMVDGIIDVEKYVGEMIC